MNYDLIFLVPELFIDFREISGNPWKSVEISGNQWKSVEIRGNPWKSVEISGNPWKSVKFQNVWISLGISECLDFSWNFRMSGFLLEFQNVWISLGISDFLGNRWKSVEFHDIFQNVWISLGFLGIPWNS